jgi:hypothetical protein
MKHGKGQRFHVPQLRQKVRTLEALFGEKRMRSKLNPRTVDKWLKEPRVTPYLTSLKRYFSVVGLKESDMIKAGDDFAKRVAEIYSELKTPEQVTYSVEDITTIYSSFLKERRPEPYLLHRSLKMIQKETVKNDFQYLKGHYHMYHYWKSRVPEDAGKVRRNLIRIDDFDENLGLMNCRIMISPTRDLKKEDWWEYEGWVFNIKNKLFWLFECSKGMPPEIVTLNIFKPPFWPNQDRFYLHGILSALSLEGSPCASRALLIKIRSEEALSYSLGYFTTEEIRTEGHGIDIMDSIANKVGEASDILDVGRKGMNL